MQQTPGCSRHASESNRRVWSSSHADKGFEYEILQGKTGAAVNDLYTPEIKAATTGYDTNNPPTIFAYDDLHTQASIQGVGSVFQAETLDPTS